MSYAVLGTLVFLAGSAALILVSRRALQHPGTHGFYRFFAWECILALVVLNLPVWGHQPLTPRQLASWFLLVTSAWLPLHAFHLLKRVGKPSAARVDDALFDFEKTSQLVTSGAFRYIRHPMYASLIYLTWAAYLKQLSWTGLALALAATALLYLTALRDEQECLAHFGEAYRAYMRGTRRFVPFLL